MEKVILKECYKHGLTEHILTSEGRYKCKECRKQAVIEKRERNKRKLVDYKGGKCEICGYNKCIDALEFHHLNPEEKKIGLTKECTISFNEMKAEADKCILVCANCHREIHFKQNEIKKAKKNEEIEKNKELYFSSGKIISNIKKIDTLPIEIIEECKTKTQKEVSEKYNISVSTLKRFLKKNK